MEKKDWAIIVLSVLVVIILVTMISDKIAQNKEATQQARDAQIKAATLTEVTNWIYDTAMRKEPVMVTNGMGNQTVLITPDMCGAQ